MTSPIRLPQLAVACAALLMTGLSFGQGVYRIVGPDGKVTYSDQPPPSADTRNVTSVNTGGGAAKATPPTGNLPYDLQQVVSKYPVTLYSAKDCGPCDMGRTLLSRRGIPFTEKTVNSPDDATAFARINKENSLPLLIIGAQQVKGFSEGQWTQYLDAAGYPKQSVLPASYRSPAAEPLAPTRVAPADASATSEATASPANEASAPTKRKRPPLPANQPDPKNPAGIRF